MTYQCHIRIDDVYGVEYLLNAWGEVNEGSEPWQPHGRAWENGDGPSVEKFDFYVVGATVTTQIGEGFEVLFRPVISLEQYKDRAEAYLREKHMDRIKTEFLDHWVNRNTVNA